MSALEERLSALREVCAGLEDKRQGPGYRYTVADIGMAAFSVFVLQSPSFLAHQRVLAEGHGRSNCQTLLGMAATVARKSRSDFGLQCASRPDAPLAHRPPSQATTPSARCSTAPRPPRSTGCSSRAWKPRPMALRRSSAWTAGCSSRSTAPSISARASSVAHGARRAGAATAAWSISIPASGATVVAPGHAQVLPLPPEFITPQDGADKQDCERAAAKRWLARHGPRLARSRPVHLGDDLYACQPVVQAIRDSGGSFILTCKPASHPTLTEYLTGVELAEHRRTVVRRGKKTTYVYRGLADVPLRGTADAVSVTWFSVEILTGAGKRTYCNSFVTDLTVTADTVADLAACGRARWKIENETFNVLKTGGYNLEHNFGHGKQTLSNLLVTLNLLAFAFHTVASLCALAWRDAVTARGARYRFFEHLRTDHRLRRLPRLASPAQRHPGPKRQTALSPPDRLTPPLDQSMAYQDPMKSLYS